MSYQVPLLFFETEKEKIAKRDIGRVRTVLVMLPAGSAGHPGSKQTPVKRVAFFYPDG